MNNKRRAEIKNIKERFAIARDMLESVLNDEQDYYDNIPENLLGSMRAEESEEAIGRLKVYEPSIFTKDTEKKLKEIGLELDNKREKLRSTLEEIRALFEMTEDYQERMKILKRYDIIDKNGKLSI